jgi:hypothetical protein
MKSHSAATSSTSGILTANSSAEFAFSNWGSMTNLSTPSYSDTTKRMSEFCRLCGSIDAAFSKAVGEGAIAIRYLGNLGMGQAPLPGRGADEVVELESGATTLADRYPCVIVCMYDINTVSGRLVLDGGFGTHPLAVCRGALRHNPYCATDNKSIAA